MVDFINFNSHKMIVQKEKIIIDDKPLEKTVLLSLYNLASTISNFGEVGLWNKIMTIQKTMISFIL